MIDALLNNWAAFLAWCEAINPISELRPGEEHEKGGAPEHAAHEESKMEVQALRVSTHAPEGERRGQHDNNGSGSVKQGSSSVSEQLANLIRPGFVKWSSAEAALVLRETRFSGQTRDLTASGEQHKAVLGEMMRRDLWRPFDKLDFARLPADDFTGKPDRLVLVNGHHRLGAQETAQRSIEWTVVIHPCSSEKEVAALYHVFDTNVRARTENQIISASGAVEMLGLSKATATALMRTVGLIAAGLDVARNKRDPIVTQIFDLRFDAAEQYADAARRLEKCFSGAGWALRKRLLRPGTFAVALVTMKYQTKKAESFWETVAQDDSLPKGDPRHTLVRTILAADAGSTSWLPMAWAASAWNAWMKGEHPGHFVPGEPRPVRVAGTPFERGR